jgi:hypothetical protein
LDCETDNGKTCRMLETTYQTAWETANDSEQSYLAGVAEDSGHAALAEVAAHSSSLWAAVEILCAAGEDHARARIATPPLLHRERALTAAWIDRRNWAACSEDAAARSQLMAALTTAHSGHVPVPARHPRLVSVPAVPPLESPSALQSPSDGESGAPHLQIV